MRYLLCWGNVSSYNHYSWEIAITLRKIGQEVFIWNLYEDRALKGYRTEHYYEPEMNQDNSIEEMITFIRKGIDCVITYSGIGNEEVQYFVNQLGKTVKYLNIFVDHPFRFQELLENARENTYVFCVDCTHIDYVKKYFPNVQHVYFLPHAGTRPVEDMIPFSQKQYPLMFCGTYKKPEMLLQNVDEMCQNNQFLKDIFMGIYEVLIAEGATQLTVEDAISQVLGQHVPESMIKNISAGCAYVDWAVRMTYRQRVITAINMKRIPLALCGTGWRDFPFDNKENVEIVTNRVLYQEMLPIMMQGKMQLNIFPWFKNGSHERIWNAMLRKSVVMTDENIWTKENFVQGYEILQYDLGQLHELPEQLEDALGKEQELEEISNNGFTKAEKCGTWEVLVKRLQDIVV